MFMTNNECGIVRLSSAVAYDSGVYGQLMNVD